MGFEHLSCNLTIDLHMREIPSICNPTNTQNFKYTINTSLKQTAAGHTEHIFYQINNSKIWVPSIQRQDRTSKLACESLKASGASGQAVLAKRIQFLVGDDDISLGSDCKHHLHLRKNNIDRIKKKSYDFDLNIYYLLS